MKYKSTIRFFAIATLVVVICVVGVLLFLPVDRVENIYGVSTDSPGTQSDKEALAEQSKKWNGTLVPPEGTSVPISQQTPWLIVLNYRYKSISGLPQQLEYKLLLEEETYHEIVSAIVLRNDYNGQFIYNGISMSEVNFSRSYGGVDIYFGATTPSKGAERDNTCFEYALVHFEQHDCVIIWDPIYEPLENLPDDSWYPAVIEDIGNLLNEQILESVRTS